MTKVTKVTMVALLLTVVTAFVTPKPVFAEEATAAEDDSSKTDVADAGVEGADAGPAGEKKEGNKEIGYNDPAAWFFFLDAYHAAAWLAIFSLLALITSKLGIGNFFFHLFLYIFTVAVIAFIGTPFAEYLVYTFTLYPITLLLFLLWYGREFFNIGNCLQNRYGKTWLQYVTGTPIKEEEPDEWLKKLRVIQNEDQTQSTNAAQSGGGEAATEESEDPDPDLMQQMMMFMMMQMMQGGTRQKPAETLKICPHCNRLQPCGCEKSTGGGSGSPPSDPDVFSV